jgi:hypothetical protein
MQYTILNETQQKSRTTVQLNQKQVHPHVIHSPNLPIMFESRTIWLLGCFSRKLRKSLQVRTWCIHEVNVCSFTNI